MENILQIHFMGAIRQTVYTGQSGTNGLDREEIRYEGYFRE